MGKVLFKFCSGEGARAILKGNTIFVTSLLDLNDPFEMRPAWTDAHENRFVQDQQMRSNLSAGMPVMGAFAGGKLRQIGTMPYIPPERPLPVESQRGISDLHNSKVFEVLHSQYRVLSLVGDLFDLEKETSESDPH